MKRIIKLSEIKKSFSPVLHRGTKDKTLIDTSLGAKNFILIHGEIRPGGEAQPHFHFMEQGVYVLSGKLAIEIENRRYKVGPHTAIFIPSNSPHRILNVGKTISRALVVLSPIPEMKKGKTVGGEWKTK